MDPRHGNEVVQIPVNKLVPNDWNPNVMNDKEFNALVKNLKEIGFVEPIMVCPRDDGMYVIISGEHRWEAAKTLDYETVPCVVKPEFDADMAKFQTMRMNMIHGRLDPEKFTKLYDEMAAKYGEEATKQLMAFTDEKAFEKVYLGAKEALPPELQKELDKRKDDIKTVDDLSRILNEIFTRYGDTLDYNFIVFSYGGKEHIWVIMDKELKELMTQITDHCRMNAVNITDVLREVIRRGFTDEVREMFVQKLSVEDESDELFGDDE